MGEDILDIERVLLQDVRVGRLYMWSATIRNLPPDALIFVIAKSPESIRKPASSGKGPGPSGESSQPWLVSP